MFAITLTPAEANHVYNTYAQRGYHWLARSYDEALLLVASTHCRKPELKAWKRVKATTKGHFPNKWPAGIRFQRYNCTGNVNKYVDIKLSYEPAKNFVREDGSSYGGYNESFLGSQAYCNGWGAPHPCGSHPSIVHLNNSRFKKGSGYSAHYRRRLIMHETGHSLGLAHHCSGDAIMNDGTSGCNGGAWTNINGYQGTDRNGIRNVYPNWMYP